MLERGALPPPVDFGGGRPAPFRVPIAGGATTHDYFASPAPNHGPSITRSIASGANCRVMRARRRRPPTREPRPSPAGLHRMQLEHRVSRFRMKSIMRCQRVGFRRSRWLLKVA
ncbi:hypothetical protein Bcep18194_C7285 [Burkholderia lata]|uniref:Uncharacterized protein n=1 Tax=Burkholderia lata (strain ATCC 17760 / DSM 23089 / LMG 22485 / NCIMB 9086 / R18194 / 383) TaxID=482957 RepID=Q39MI7_BURL3|nr:hypothetical protein Bcep18194_C7285 [Burkholderia lata]